ncbi:MAG TPA: thioredoxin family protein [Fimbriiglobus sp.]|jgi:peroxiredoxin|nr:thioredoxin family protein [Fimbriiglobus sp.]
MIRPTTALTLAVLLAPTALAGEFNKVLSPGDAAPAWAGLEGTDGKKHALADLKGKDVVVVVFTCNSCPVAVGYEDRIIAFAKAHAAADSKVAVVAINVNTIKEDQLPEMTKRAEKKKFPFAYLYDPTQEIAKKFGANYTPEFFVLNRDRKVVYMGSMDDKSPPTAAKVSHLEDAVKAALAGKAPPTGETLARGCRIRFNRANADR